MSELEQLSGDLKDEETNPPEGHIAPEPPEDSWEQRAEEMGWVPEEDWKGDPELWTPAREFVKFGEVLEANKRLHSKIDHMENQFSNRLDNLQQFHEHKLKAERARLTADRDAAAEEADMEAYKRANDGLEALDKKPENLKPANPMENIVNHPSTQAFIQKNPWIKGQDPKGVYGQKIFTDWLTQNINNPNAILEDGLKFVEDEVSKSFPPRNKNRERTNQMGERKGGPKKSGSKLSITMDDLTPMEKDMFQSFGSSYKTEKDFLQAVLDARGS
jgi:hypothetical protein